jgi:hypothetical protein
MGHFIKQASVDDELAPAAASILEINEENRTELRSASIK